MQFYRQLNVSNKKQEDYKLDNISQKDLSMTKLNFTEDSLQGKDQPHRD